jgi:hypothetical protein
MKRNHYLITAIVPLVILMGCKSMESRYSLLNDQNCNLITALLKTEPLESYINQNNQLKLIRIIDQTNKIKAEKCSLGTHGILVTNKIKPDINTGYYIDILIYQIIRLEKDRYSVRVFYAPHQKENCEYRTKMNGEGVFNMVSDSTFFENFSVSFVQ